MGLGERAGLAVLTPIATSCRRGLRLGHWISDVEGAGDKSGFSGVVGTEAGLEQAKSEWERRAWEQQGNTALPREGENQVVAGRRGQERVSISGRNDSTAGCQWPGSSEEKTADDVGAKTCWRHVLGKVREEAARTQGEGTSAGRMETPSEELGQVGTAAGGWTLSGLGSRYKVSRGK